MADEAPWEDYSGTSTATSAVGGPDDSEPWKAYAAPAADAAPKADAVAPGHIKPGGLADSLITTLFGPEPSAQEILDAKPARPSFAEPVAKAIDAVTGPLSGGRAQRLTDLMDVATRPQNASDQIIPEVPAQSTTGGQIAAGAANLPIRFANFALSPEGVALTPALGMAPKALRTITGLLFGEEEARAAYNAPTLQEKISHGLGALAIGAGTGIDALSKEAPAAKPEEGKPNAQEPNAALNAIPPVESQPAQPEAKGQVQTGDQGNAPAQEVAAAPEAVAPAAEAPAPKKFRGPADAFGSEVTPVAQFLSTGDGLMSKSTAKKLGKFEGTTAQWDGAGDVLSHPTHNKIYKATGDSPADAAQAAYDAGLINDPSPDALWSALQRESQTARTLAREERDFSKAEAQAHVEWQDQLKHGEPDPGISLVGPDGEPALITKGSDGKGVELSLLDKDGNPSVSLPHETLDEALKSAHEQGFLLADEAGKGKAIFDESASRAGNADNATSGEAPPATSEVAGEVPKLRPGEKQGDLLSKQTEDLTLAGEAGVDHGARQAAADASAKAKAESDAANQTQLFNEPEAVKGGVVPAEKVVAGSPVPAEAAEISPQALGIKHPLPGFLQDAVDYFTKNTPSQVWNSVKGSLDATLGKTFAKTTIADREAGELGARWISSRIAAPHLADTFTTQVLDGTGVDPVKFGAALTEDNLRSVRADFEAKAEEAYNSESIVSQLKEDLGNLKDADTEDPAIRKQISQVKKDIARISKLTEEDGKRAEEAAKGVTTIIGSKNSPFKTEDAMDAFLREPGTQTAIERHRALWSEVIDPMYRNAQLMEPDVPLPSRGLETQARVNLYNDPEAKGPNVVAGTGGGNLTATFRRKSPFAIQARGTGQSYNVDYGAMMANTFGRQLEIANKNAFETKLVDTGNAIIDKPGQRPTLPDGEATVAFPLKRTTIITAEDGSKVPVNQNIYVRKSLAGEYRRGADVDLLKVPAALKAFNNVTNRAALAGLTDASVHVLNLSTALFTRPSVAGGALTDSLLSTFGRADVPVTVTKVLTKALQDNRAQVSELAEIGAMRADRPTGNPLGKAIQWMDKTTRLVLDDAFQRLAKSGLVEDTETNRREFVNQVGQYNKRAQGDLRRLARDSGFGPFATAGTTFNALGLRTITGSPGIPATSPMAAAALRANVLSKWVGGAVFAGTMNYLLTKDKGGGVMGRPGVPIGKIDTGLNDENDRPLSIPFFDLIGLGRALRVTGARGFIESQRKGLTLSNSFDAATTDLWNSNISPFTGPAIRFAGVASSGKQLPAINVPRTSQVVPPGESQAQENLKQAIIDANPVLKSLYLAQQPGQGTRAAILQQIPRISLQPSQSAEFMDKYPEIVRKAQSREYINDVIGRARKMNPDDQVTFVQGKLEKLSDEDRKQAERVLKYSRIHYQ